MQQMCLIHTDRHAEQTPADPRTLRVQSRLQNLPVPFDTFNQALKSAQLGTCYSISSLSKIWLHSQKFWKVTSPAKKTELSSCLTYQPVWKPLMSMLVSLLQLYN